MVVLRCSDQTLTDIEAVIFDKDGTLADSRQFLQKLAMARAKACAQAFNAEHSEPLEIALLQIFGVTSAGLDPDGLMAVGTRQANEQGVIAWLVQEGYVSKKAARLVPQLFTVVDQQMPSKVTYTPPYRGTQSMLERLCRSSSLKVGVLSSDSTANVTEFLQYYSLEEGFADWQGTDSGQPPKPDPFLLKNLCNRLAVAVDRTVIVGDSWVDKALAEVAGARFISVSELWGRSPVAGAEFVLSHWDDLQVE